MFNVFTRAGRRCLATLALAAAVTATVVAPAAAMPQPQAVGADAILDQMPADAQIVIVVPSLSGLSNTVATLAQSMNLPLPPLTNGLGMLKQMSGVQGLDDNGAAAIVVSNLPIPGPNGQPPANREPNLVILVPVSDYSQFAQGFQGNASGVSQVTLPGNEGGYIKQMGSYAVIAEREETAKSYAGAAGAQSLRAVVRQAGGLSTAAVNGSDLYMLVNMQSMGEQLRPIVRQAIGQQRQMMQMMMGNDPSAQSAMVMMDVMQPAVDAFLRDASLAVVAADGSAAGVSLTSSLQFKPDSACGNFFTRPGQARQRLNVLPGGNYLFAVSMDLQALPMIPMMQQALNAIPEAQRQGWFVQMMEPAVQLGQRTRWGAQVVFPPDLTNPAGGLMQSVAVMEVDDAAAYVAGYKNYLQMMSNMSIDTGMGPDMAVRYATSYNEGVQQISGVSFDRYSINTQLPAPLLQQMGPMAGFYQAFANTQGFVGRKGNHVIVSTGLNTNHISQTLQSLNQGQGLGTDPAIARMQQQVFGQNTAAEGYLNLAPIANTANMFMTMMGAGGGLQAPANLPPIGFAMHTQAGGVSNTVHVPMPVINFVKDAAMKLNQQFGQGGQGDDGSAPQGNRPPGF